MDQPLNCNPLLRHRSLGNKVFHLIATETEDDIGSEREIFDNSGQHAVTGLGRFSAHRHAASNQVRLSLQLWTSLFPGSLSISRGTPSSRLGSRSVRGQARPIAFRLARIILVHSPHP